jgi:hypothetical protein
MNKLKFLVFSVLISASTFQIQGQQTIGALVNTPEAMDAYTFFSVTFGRKSYLIDNCGEVIRDWDHQFRAGLAGYMLPDGRILRTSSINHPRISQTSQGGLLEIYGWDGDLEWSYDFTDNIRTQHHDIVYMENGNILVLAWEFIDDDEVVELGRDLTRFNRRDLYGEAVYEIKPVGVDDAEIIWEWHLRDHYVQDYDPTKLNYVTDIGDHPRKYDFNYFGFSAWSTTDWTHCNALDYNAERDEVLINCRGGNEFWIIDHSTTTAQAATDTGGTRGHGGDFLYRWGNPGAYKKGNNGDIKLFGAHGLEWIPNDRPYGGSIVAFNNGLPRPAGNFSTVEVVTPAMDEDGNYLMDTDGIFMPEDAVYTYTASGNPRSFFSNYQSNAYFLANGHLFTNRGDYGHFVELDSNEQVVWEYINPAGASGPAQQGQYPQSSSVFTATRLPANHSAFDGKDLTPQGVIELDSDYTDCLIYSAVSPIDQGVNTRIWYSAQEDMLYIEPDVTSAFVISIWTMDGKQVGTFHCHDRQMQIRTHEWAVGTYVVAVTNDEGRMISKLMIKP